MPKEWRPLQRFDCVRRNILQRSKGKVFRFQTEDRWQNRMSTDLTRIGDLSRSPNGGWRAGCGKATCPVPRGLGSQLPALLVGGPILPEQGSALGGIGNILNPEMVRYEYIVITPFQGSIFCKPYFPGRCPGLSYSALSELGTKFTTKSERTS